MGSIKLPPPPIVHVVHFRFYSTISPEVRAAVSRKFLSLQFACLSPVTRKPYIRSFTGGRDISIESLQKGYSHVFMLEFANEQDRNWYVNEDPVHKRFGVDELTGVVEDVMVVDFKRGQL
ncbi:hypothetical protein RBB50_006116 [Rhinocladiella similis]